VALNTKSTFGYGHELAISTSHFSSLHVLFCIYCHPFHPNSLLPRSFLTKFWYLISPSKLYVKPHDLDTLPYSILGQISQPLGPGINYTGASSYKTRIYWTTVSQRLRTTVLGHLYNSQHSSLSSIPGLVTRTLYIFLTTVN
jgi:hypothetical protein